MTRLKPDQLYCLLCLFLALLCIAWGLNHSANSKNDGSLVEKIFEYYYGLDK